MTDARSHILLVEDDEVDVMTVRRAFKSNNLVNPLHVARDGVEALAMLRGTDGHERMSPMPRVVLLDLNMPRMGGIEFLREVRADPELKALSVFVLTTSDQDADRVDAFDLNVAGYIIKPVEFQKFVEAVGTLKAFWQLSQPPRD